MSLPTLTLALIAKNEEKNLQRLLDSVSGCMDEIILVDTGSTDKTKEIAEKNGCKVYDFEWVNSFCKARNFAFSKATCDYVMWLDCDDALKNKEAFIKWKNTAMEFTDCWFAAYNYAVDKDFNPIISFIRERVFKRSLNPEWKYDLHEGIVLQPHWSKDYAIVWGVNHLRDAEDIKADKSRNIKILEEIKSSKGFDARMQFYYGKELYEADKPHEAVIAFDEALKKDLEHHDRLLSLQYAAYACMRAADQFKDEFKVEKDTLYHKAIGYCLDGIELDSHRAEYHVCLGDIYLKKQDIVKAIPHYGAAKWCINPRSNGSPYEGAIYSFTDCYGLAPSINLSKIFSHLGQLEIAQKEAKECVEKYKSKEAEEILLEINRIKNLTNLDNNQEQTEDIVFTCPPQNAYEFDEELYKTKGMGGSETALIEMAKHLKKITGRPVKVFNMRTERLVADSGVEYLPSGRLMQYMYQYKPRVHIAWRHNMKLTNAPTYLWCHDLVTPTVESAQNFDKILCLSEFHKSYVQAKQGVSDEKIVVTRNGINPDKFIFEGKRKNPNKLVWMSSPDRGLDRAMLVCDEVRKDYPNIELHVYYGLDNLYKYGLSELAEKLKSMMDARPYVKYHGFTEQKEMYIQVSDAVAWVHPCNFIETFCITALEMQALSIFPITRSLGALKNTLAEPMAKGQAIMLDHDCATPEQVKAYAEKVKYVLHEQKWIDMFFNVHKHSWESVAREWCGFMGFK